MTYRNFYLDATNLADKIRSGEYKQVQDTRAGEAQNALVRRPKKEVVQESQPKGYRDLTAEYLRLASFTFEDVPEEVAARVDAYGEGSTSLSPTFSKPVKEVNLKGKEEFIAAIYPAAVEEAKRLGIDPRLIVAQAAIETGWGKSAPGNNFFGIKSHGKSGGQNLSTKEVYDGKEVTINASFRTFDSPQDSVKGYADFLLSNPRYSGLLSSPTLEDQAVALQDSGYATDPNYGQKVYSIAAGLPPISNEGSISFVRPKAKPFNSRDGK